MTDRAVSTAVGYVLMIGIAGILLASLTLGATSLVDSQDGRTVQAELDVYGERLAADVATADRLALRGSNRTVNVTTELPRVVSGHRYTITIDGADDGDGNATITLEPDDVDRSVTTGVANTTPIADAELRGGELRIVYDPEAEALVIENA